jgi:hypothetical protein
MKISKKLIITFLLALLSIIIFSTAVYYQQTEKAREIERKTEIENNYEEVETEYFMGETEEVIEVEVEEEEDFQAKGFCKFAVIDQNGKKEWLRTPLYNLVETEHFQKEEPIETIEDFQAKGFYKLEVVDSGEENNKNYRNYQGYPCFGSLHNCLVSVFDIGIPTSWEERKDIISYIFGKTDDSRWIYPFGEGSNEYYILVEPEFDKIDTEKIYSFLNFKIKASLADKKLLPFLLDPEYCEIDTDCSISNYFPHCSYGAYNPYEEFFDVGGCESVIYPQEGDDYSENIYNLCEDKSLFPNIEYDGAKCIENKCVPQNREIICTEGGWDFY